MLKINNRRYIGNKTKLLEEILQSVPSNYNPKDTTFADLFAGTGSVAMYFSERNFKTIVNDTLYSNYVSYMAWLSGLEYNSAVVDYYLDYYNQLEYSSIESNYFSDIYADKYFSINDAKKIGYIREHLETIRTTITKREYYILLASLIYAADKIANTVGHFEYFLKNKPNDSDFKMESLEINDKLSSVIYNCDANSLVRRIKCDIAYIDPPYNARQYVNFYHVLENLARWEKPTVFEGNSMKFKRDELKSGYSRSEAPVLFADLIRNLDCKFLIVSYNNTYNAKSAASNNKISENEIIEILSTKGKVSKKEINYKSFNAGKTDFKEHKEFIYTCEVQK
jgi:adenine-specific DNA-methyltransferase